MRRQRALVRLILLKADGISAATLRTELVKCGYDTRVVDEHVRLCRDAGFLQGDPVGARGGLPNYTLTWGGHNELDALGDVTQDNQFIQLDSKELTQVDRRLQALAQRAPGIVQPLIPAVRRNITFDVGTTNINSRSTAPSVEAVTVKLSVGDELIMLLDALEEAFGRTS